MIEQMSPITRRIVAVGLLILLILLAVQLVVVPVATAIAEYRGRLLDIRTERARLIARTSRPLPRGSTMPPGLAITASTPLSAGQRLTALLQGSARIARIVLIASPPSPVRGQASVVGSDVTVTGTEPSVMSFISLVEHGTPTIRFARCSIAASAPVPGSEPSIRFTGYAVAAWREL